MDSSKQISNPYASLHLKMFKFINIQYLNARYCRIKTSSRQILETFNRNWREILPNAMIHNGPAPTIKVPRIQLIRNKTSTVKRFIGFSTIRTKDENKQAIFDSNITPIALTFVSTTQQISRIA